MSTAPASAVTDTGAVLNGTVNPEGQATEDAFQWGPTTGYGHETTVTSAGSGTTAANISATLAGLAPGSVYHFRTIALSAGGTSVGADETFTTSGTAPASAPAPTAVTGSASNLAQSSMTLSGTVDPDGQQTTDYFEFGPTSNYGYETTPSNAGAGTSDLPVTASLTGLSSSTIYHYRIVAVSAGGTTLGADHTATTTTPPQVTTGSPSKIDSSSGVLNAVINPEGQSTTYYFQFGTTTAYGLQTPPTWIGSSTADVAVHHEPQGLVADTTYHYRVVAQNAGGISYGADRTLTTIGATEIVSRLRILGRMGFVSRSGWVGVVLGCFAGQTSCAGHLTITRGATILAQRNFTVTATNGGFQNVRLSGGAMRLFRGGYTGPVMSEVTATTTSGQHTAQALSLASWR